MAQAPSEPAAPSSIPSFAALVWQHLVNDAMANYLPGILPALSAFGIPVFLLGVMATVQTLGQTLQPFTGILADRRGGRTFVMVGPLLSACAVFGIAFSHNYPVLLVAALLTGIGNSIFHPQALTAARTLAVRRTGAQMSVFMIGGEFGRAMGPLAAGALVAAGGMPWLAVLVGLPLIGLPWLVRAVPRARPRPVVHAALHLRQRLGAVASLLAYTGLRAAAISGVSVLLPIYWRDQGGSLVVAATLVTTFLGLGMAGNIAGGILRDRFGPKSILYGTSTVSAFLVLILLRVHGLWLWPVLGVLGMALFATSPVTMILGQDTFPENPGFGSGLALGAGNAIGALLLLPITFVADHVSILSGLWVVLAYLALSIAAVPGLLLRSQAASSPAVSA